MLFTLCTCLSWAVTPTSKKGDAKQSVVYVSSSYRGKRPNGTQSRPYKSIAEAIAAAEPNATLMLKCGDRYTITESINLHTKQLSIDSYGRGAKPSVSGFVQLPTNKLKKVSKTGQIWRLPLGSSIPENIGFVYDRQADKIVFGKRVAKHDKLAKEGEFCVEEGTLYLYSTQALKSRKLEVAYHLTAFEFLSNCTVQNIRVEGFGRHGFAGISRNATIRNVEIDLIGGSIASDGARLGNGIELWISRTGPKETTRPHDVLVEHCTISRTFDAACTIQGEILPDASDSFAAENIVFAHNVIRNCRQSYECFVRQYDKDGKYMHNHYPLRNCRFEYNDCRDAGQNEFGCPEHRDCHLYGGVPGMTISGNRFEGGGYIYCFPGQQFDISDDNECILRQGETIIKVYDSKQKKYTSNITMSTSADVKKYQKSFEKGTKISLAK